MTWANYSDLQNPLSSGPGFQKLVQIHEIVTYSMGSRHFIESRRFFRSCFFHHPRFISEWAGMEQTTPENHTKKVDQDSPLQVNGKCGLLSFHPCFFRKKNQKQKE